jgi:hypothetical protein
MDPRHKLDLDRVGKESAAAIAAGHASCADTAAHIKASRQAIRNSLRLLGQRVPGFDD